MHIAIIGATGAVGSKILAEAAGRGHQITAISRHPEKTADLPGVTPKACDMNDAVGLAAALKGHEAVISSVKFLEFEPEALIATVKRSGVPRFLVVGGTASLLVESGERLIDVSTLPPERKVEPLAGCRFLELLRAEKDLDWTFLSPSGRIAAGERTGKFRLGLDHVLTNAQGEPAGVSQEDFAIAMVGELEKPQHSRRRFTAGN